MSWALQLCWDTLRCAWLTHARLGWSWRRSLAVAIRGHRDLWRYSQRPWPPRGEHRP